MRLYRAIISVFDPGANQPPASSVTQQVPGTPVHVNFNMPPQAQSQPVQVVPAKTPEQLAEEARQAEIARLTAQQRPVAEPEKVTHGERLARLESEQVALRAENLRQRMIISAQAVGKQFIPEMVTGITPQEIAASIDYSEKALAARTAEIERRVEQRYAQGRQGGQPQQQNQQPPAGYAHGQVPPPGYPQPQTQPNLPQYASPAQAFNAGNNGNMGNFPDPRSINSMSPQQWAQQRGQIMGTMQQAMPQPGTVLNPWQTVAPPVPVGGYNGAPPPGAYGPPQIPPGYVPPQPANAPQQFAQPQYPTVVDHQLGSTLQQAGANFGTNDPNMAAFAAQQSILSQRQSN